MKLNKNSLILIFAYLLLSKYLKTLPLLYQNLPNIVILTDFLFYFKNSFTTYNTVGYFEVYTQNVSFSVIYKLSKDCC